MLKSKNHSDFSRKKKWSFCGLPKRFLVMYPSWAIFEVLLERSPRGYVRAETPVLYVSISGLARDP